MSDPLFENCTTPIAMAERRESTRRRYDMSVALQILFPEETFTPVIYACRSHDVALRGMRIVLDQLPLSLYTKLLTSIRYARISFTNVFSGEEIKLTGRIVWIDYRKPDSTESSGLCYMAISFDDRDNQDLTRYMEFCRCVYAHSPMAV